ncbi:GyrI-like domain-containing protein [Cohnella ginsengisoli]|uniref:GyrI-like domain-containing protein n=1 Tax=Cohnella ginsengisoli TaxID=425004 RepID=A0A9X4QPC7_9BACL|nr:effector binding domain-containing protein [Cohnella ginsengisoli]MDG0794194.1 GyrI-like domain-containing protein [Cohnella ginsengisoli]
MAAIRAVGGAIPRPTSDWMASYLLFSWKSPSSTQWAEIWQWSQQAGNERTFTGDFEHYGPHVDPKDGQVEIYIAIS